MTADPAPSLQYLNARDYLLVVTADNDWLVTIEHPVGGAGMKAVARRRMARLAAEIVDEVGPRAVADELDAIRAPRTAANEVTRAHLARGVVVVPPVAGVAVMPCSRCGRMLSALDMHRARPREGMAGHVLAPIVCLECSLS